MDLQLQLLVFFAGSYSVTVIDSNGCQIIDTAHVTESDSVLVFTSIVSDLSVIRIQVVQFL